MAGTLLSSIMNFYWGDSKSSKDKDEVIAESVKANGKVVEAVTNGNIVPAEAIAELKDGQEH